MWLVLALTLLAHSAPWLELTYSGITPQLYEWDCAPACADTLLSWSQIPVQDGIWEEVTEPGKPISFRHLQHYFAAYSLEAAGYRLDWDAFSSFLEENRGTPLLVHFTEGKGHFALVWDLAQRECSLAIRPTVSSSSLSATFGTYGLEPSSIFQISTGSLMPSRYPMQPAAEPSSCKL